MSSKPTPVAGASLQLPGRRIGPRGVATRAPTQGAGKAWAAQGPAPRHSGAKAVNPGSARAGPRIQECPLIDLLPSIQLWPRLLKRCVIKSQIQTHVQVQENGRGEAV